MSSYVKEQMPTLQDAANQGVINSALLEDREQKPLAAPTPRTGGEMVVASPKMPVLKSAPSGGGLIAQNMAAPTGKLTAEDEASIAAAPVPEAARMNLQRQREAEYRAAASDPNYLQKQQASAQAGAAGTAAPSTVGARERVSPVEVTDPVMKQAEKIAATTGVVDKGTMTVQGQLEGLLAGDNALIQQAKARAMKEANSRGLINSSMAAQAGEEAMISQALPIAQQDASTQFSQGRANQDAENNAGIINAQLQRDRDLAEFSHGSNRALQQEGSNLRLNEGEQQYQNSNSMFERDNALKRELTMAGIRSNEQIAASNAAAAGASASAQMQIAQADIASRERLAVANQNFQREAMNFDAQTRTALAEMENNARVQLNNQNLGANTYGNFTNQYTAIATAQMEPEDRDRMLGNLSSLYNGNPYMPINITIPPPSPSPSASSGLNRPAGTPNLNHESGG